MHMARCHASMASGQVYIILSPRWQTGQDLPTPAAVDCGLRKLWMDHWRKDVENQTHRASPSSFQPHLPMLPLQCKGRSHYLHEPRFEQGQCCSARHRPSAPMTNYGLVLTANFLKGGLLQLRIDVQTPQNNSFPHSRHSQRSLTGRKLYSARSAATSTMQTQNM